MSQDKPVLSRKQIHEMCDVAVGLTSIWTRKNAVQLCDLALSALDRQGSAREQAMIEATRSHVDGRDGV
jgi:hypothetical protein